jgi:DNA-binding NarL/FixJ family response regulator
VLGAPLTLDPGTPEAQIVRRAEGARDGRATRPSMIAPALGLRDYALAAIVPEARALALVVVDREDRAVEPADLHEVQLFAHLVGGAIDRAVQRSRLQELTAELRHLTASTTALMQEALHAPLTLPEDYGNGPVFRQVTAAPAAPESLRAMLTDREADVIQLLVEGLSNRLIGERLNLSTATVKDHVARILSKLGASNRVDAVGIYLRLAAQTHQSGETSPPPGV